MNIKIVRIISGEELVGEWNETTLVITNPVIMVPVSKDQIGFAPWLPLSDDEDIQLKEQHILTVVTPEDKLQNEYNRVYGSGLIMPGDGSILH
tara:strand:- start:548 stop:826 length:279 start_codon:yes stop_codon:yes gene_type:complete